MRTCLPSSSWPLYSSAATISRRRFLASRTGFMCAFPVIYFKILSLHFLLKHSLSSGKITEKATATVLLSLMTPESLRYTWGQHTWGRAGRTLCYCCFGSWVEIKTVSTSHRREPSLSNLLPKAGLWGCWQLLLHTYLLRVFSLKKESLESFKLLSCCFQFV